MRKKKDKTYPLSKLKAYEKKKEKIYRSFCILKPKDN